jgi:hypothetical protein
LGELVEYGLRLDETARISGDQLTAALADAPCGAALIERTGQII